jgi:hypothetical protein
LRPRLKRLEAQAGRAGLTDCLTHEERRLVPDGVRSPIFVARLERHDRRFVQRIPVYDAPASTPAQLADRMRALGRLLDGAVADASTFDPPDDAAKATGLYVAATRRLRTVVRRFDAFVRGGGATTSPARLRSHQRAFRRAYREAGLASGRMRSRAGMPPAPAADEEDVGGQES